MLAQYDDYFWHIGGFCQSPFKYDTNAKKKKSSVKRKKKGVEAVNDKSMLSGQRTAIRSLKIVQKKSNHKSNSGHNNSISIDKHLTSTVNNTKT